MEEGNQIELETKQETEKIDKPEKEESIIENINASDVKDITDEIPDEVKKLFNLE